MELKNGIATFYAASKEEWRKWLEENHSKTKSVWLIIYKKESGKPSVTYKEAVEQALCFGWIDSKPNKRDEESFYQFFAQRNPKSNWSKVNKAKVEELIKQKLMTEAGYKMIEIAKQNGTWDALNEVEASVVPSDLQEALNANALALNNFNAFPRSSKRNILEWILNAKQPATRLKRIEETVRLAADNIKANHYRQ